MKLSVAMCTYNGMAYLGEQLASIAAQVRPPDELVVCDDFSTDGTPELVGQFAATARFPVRLFVNEQTVGSTVNFGRAISLCQGDLIALADQDDVWLPEKLQQTERAFAASNTPGLVFTDAEVVDAVLRPSGRRLWDLVGFDSELQNLVRKGRALDVLLPCWTVTGATMAFRAEFRSLVLPIPENLAVIHDGWVALVIAAVADVSFLNEPLLLYRQHPRQQIGAPKGNREKGTRVTQLDDLQEALRRQNSYDDLLRIAMALRERLLSNPGWPAREHALSKLEERITHLRSRSNLPKGAAARLRVVLGELWSRRYHRYSNGVYSAAKDLVSGGVSKPDTRTPTA